MASSAFLVSVLSLLLLIASSTAAHKQPRPSPPLPPQPPAIPLKSVAVQGVVYCKSCKYRGVNTLTDAHPLLGAVVQLQCNNTKYGLLDKTKTDKNGYFFFRPEILKTSGSDKCKVTLVSSPLPKCNVTTNLHDGAIGAILKPPVDPRPLPFALFTVGPFAFEPSKKLPCHY